MKRKHGNQFARKGNQSLDRKWKKIGREVVVLCQKATRDAYRMKAGLEVLKSMDADGETMEETLVVEVQKKESCEEIGKGICNMVTVRNMSTDWIEKGWLHWKKIFTKPFVEDLLAPEVYELKMLGFEEETALLKKTRVEYTERDPKLEAILKQIPVHENVIFKMMETMTGGGGIVRETLFEMKENVIENKTKGITQEGLTQKQMKELLNGNTRSHEEPIAMFIPLTTRLSLTTFQQYKMHVGRPKKGKIHEIEVGDVFIVNWRLSHALSYDNGGKKVMWIVLGAARSEKHLMY